MKIIWKYCISLCCMAAVFAGAGSVTAMAETADAATVEIQAESQAAKPAPTEFAHITSCEVTGGNQVSLKGQMEGSWSDPAYYDNYLYLFEMKPYQRDLKGRTDYAAWITKGDELSFQLPLNHGTQEDRLYSSFVVAVYDGSEYTIVSNEAYVANPESVAKYTDPYKTAQTKKGLLIQTTPAMLSDAFSLGVNHVIVNIPFNHILGSGIDYEYDGKTYHFNKDVLAVYDDTIKRMSEKEEKEMLEKLLDYPIPGIIFCRELHPDELFRQIAIEKGVPLLMTKRATSSFTAELIRWLNVKLAPCISVHGVLVDVYGEGVLITGESGIGKSEAALELIKRGHRLVTDDVVEIRKVSEETLVGTAPDITKHFIELRGIGIVDVKALFGASSVRETQNIDLVIRLEEWDKDREYDRLGLEEEYTEYLGNKVVCHNIPIRPGRNLAIICEAAAVNHRQKKMGYNAAQELYTRVQNSLARKRNEDEDED